MHRTRQLPREIAALSELFSFLGSCLDEQSISGRTAFIVNLAAEEIFTNLVRHNVTSGSEISFDLEISSEQVRLRFTDRGVESFDPAQLPAVDVTRPAEEREPGGLGVHLVRTMLDRLHYEFEDGEMRVLAIKRRDA